MKIAAKTTFDVKQTREIVIFSLILLITAAFNIAILVMGAQNISTIKNDLSYYLKNIESKTQDVTSLQSQLKTYENNLAQYNAVPLLYKSAITKDKIDIRKIIVKSFDKKNVQPIDSLKFLVVNNADSTSKKYTHIETQHFDIDISFTSLTLKDALDYMDGLKYDLRCTMSPKKLSIKPNMQTFSEDVLKRVKSGGYVPIFSIQYIFRCSYLLS